MLSVGRINEASADIEKARKLEPAYALPLLSIIALAQNDKPRGLELAMAAVKNNPESATARVALAYAQQANFDFQAALENQKKAVAFEKNNALAWARLAELWLSFGKLDKAISAAQKAVLLSPHLARTQTVLGFAHLSRIEIHDSTVAFEKAIKLDQADPLPHLGMGLTMIRTGNLKDGRAQIEIAVSLDPNKSIMRSYLGKAYYEEKRNDKAGVHLDSAKKLDPKDPTPWFYDAIRKLTMNCPVEAMRDLQKSIKLNDNRAVYRSRLLLDQDIASRSVSLARIYNELGFDQLALVEGWKSLNIDPSNYSAHRFLSDSYTALPRHEIARVSELLQSQLLQPVNINPVQPHLAESKSFILADAGPAEASFNEFNQLFNRNRLALIASGVAGSNSTLGDEVVQSGVCGNFFYSLGQFHYETDGFRENNDQERDIYNLFAQIRLTPTTSIQAEYRFKETNAGDLPLRFDPDNYDAELRQEEEIQTMRFGLHNAFSPNSDILFSLFYKNGDAQITLPVLFSTVDEEGCLAELQYLFYSERFNIISGMGHFNDDLKEAYTISIPFIFPPVVISEVNKTNIRHNNLYLYSLFNYPNNVTWTLGASADFFESTVDREKVNPKLGCVWKYSPSTTFRAAVFRTLKRALIANQTLEPTSVSGFNQFFDDANGTDAWRYGVGIDQNFSENVYGGMEFSRREMDVPFLSISNPFAQPSVLSTDWEERFGRAYLYWIPYSMLAISAEFEYEKLERDDEYVGPEQFTWIKTFRIPLTVSFSHSSGFFSKLKITFVDQDGEFGDPQIVTTTGNDQFAVVDGTIGYRLPEKLGVVTVDVKNLFDEQFQFQDTDPSNPRIYPDCGIFVKFTTIF